MSDHLCRCDKPSQMPDGRCGVCLKTVPLVITRASLDGLSTQFRSALGGEPDHCAGGCDHLTDDAQCGVCRAWCACWMVSPQGLGTWLCDEHGGCRP